ncbi:MAG TPA: hypothetical protein VHH73_12725, partial [Verrucomicrobiae bacterium]|nr:hypothetical protein [Verrucomicrobiae bacterium]
FGRANNDPNDNTARGLNWGFSQYKQFLRQSDCPQPAMTWVTLDEQPDSVNDAFFITDPNVNNWQDIPASYHNGACGFSFADGHAEIHKWLSATSKYPGGKYAYPSVRSFDAAGKQDMAWYKARIQQIPAK